MEQYPYSRVEATLRRFHSVVEIHLSTLRQHKNNIEKFRVCQRWKDLNKEQVNASRTVQQISSCLREAEKTRNYVQEADLPKYDKAVSPLRQKALTVLSEFLQQESSSSSASEHGAFSVTPDEGQLSTEQKFALTLDDPLRLHKEREGEIDVDGNQAQVQEHHEGEKSANTDEEQAKVSWFTLEKNITDLNAMMRYFSSAVRTQRQSVDSIEDNVEKSHENIHQGVENLSYASRLKSAMLPIGGAVVGGLVGGPVGLAVGAKIGLAAGVGGGALGYFGGRYVKNRRDESNDVEMKNMESKLHFSTK